MAKRVQPRRKTLHHERKLRISSRVRHALQLMIEAGRNRAEAAEIAGIRDDSLYRALKRPDVLALRGELMNVLRSSAASKSIARVDRLADSATSEHVRLAAAELLLGLDGHVPVARTEGRIIHEHSRFAPGLTIVRHDPQAAAERAKAIEATKPLLIDVQPSEHVLIEGDEDAK